MMPPLSLVRQLSWTAVSIGSANTLRVLSGAKAPRLSEDTFLHWKCVPCVVRLPEEVLVVSREYAAKSVQSKRKMPIAGSGCSGSTVARAGAICRHHRNDPIVGKVDEIVKIARRDRPEYEQLGRRILF